MGRFWLGIGLILSLLVLGLWNAAAMDQLHRPISQTLEKAASLSLSGEAEQGFALAQQAKDHWQQHWRSIASVSDHTPMDEIDGLFAQMERYAQAGDPVEFAAHCARLALRIDAVGDAHQLTWWNLL